MSWRGTTVDPWVGPSSAPRAGPRRPGGEAAVMSEARNEQGNGPALADRCPTHDPAGSDRRAAADPPGPSAQDAAPGKIRHKGGNAAMMQSGGLNAFPSPGGHSGPGEQVCAEANRNVAPGRPRASPAPASARRRFNRAASSRGRDRSPPPLPPMTAKEEEDKKGKTGRLGSGRRSGRPSRPT